MALHSLFLTAASGEGLGQGLRAPRPPFLPQTFCECRALVLCWVTSAVKKQRRAKLEPLIWHQDLEGLAPWHTDSCASEPPAPSRAPGQPDPKAWLSQCPHLLAAPWGSRLPSLASGLPRVWKWKELVGKATSRSHGRAEAQGPVLEGGLAPRLPAWVSWGSHFLPGRLGFPLCQRTEICTLPQLKRCALREVMSSPAVGRRAHPGLREGAA